MMIIKKKGAALLSESELVSRLCESLSACESAKTI